jgi:hypothetical protein
MGLATLGELKSTTTERDVRTGMKNRCSPRAAAAGGAAQNPGFQAKVEKTRARDFDRLAQVGEVEFGDHVRGELARIEFSRLGQRHQAVRLVIAKFGIAGPDQHARGGRGRQRRRHGGLQPGLE